MTPQCGRTAAGADSCSGELDGRAEARRAVTP
jgi:hypothetical protein